MNVDDHRGWGAIGGFLLLCGLGLVGLVVLVVLSTLGRPSDQITEEAFSEIQVVEPGRHVTGDINVATGDIQVAPGAIVDGSVTAANGTILIDTGARVRDDVTANAGAVLVRGQVGGNVSSFNGTIVLEPDAVVSGTVLATIGDVYVQPGAQVYGQVRATGRVISDGVPPDLIGLPPTRSTASGLAALLAALAGVAGGLAGLVLGAGLMVLVPRRIARIEGTLEHALRPSAIVGGLSAVLLPVVWALLSLVLSITLIGPPLLTLCLGVALFGGLVGVGLWLGEHLAGRGRLPGALQSSLGHGLLGLGIILGGTLLLALFVPWLAGLVLYAISCLGLGAVILSRGGALAPIGTTPLPFSLPTRRPAPATHPADETTERRAS